MTKKINQFLIYGLSIFSLCYLFLYVEQLSFSRILILILMVPALLVPSLLRKVFHIEISDEVELFYIVFVFFAQLCGSVFRFYQRYYFYDKLLHLTSGILTSIVALVLLQNTKIKNVSLFSKIIFMILFTMAIAGFWEIFEFCSDILLQGDTQNVLTTGVDDTMLDIVSALLGSILFGIFYYFYQKKWKGKH